MRRFIIIFVAGVILVLIGYFLFFRTASEPQVIPQGIASSEPAQSPVPSLSPPDITADDVRAAGFAGTIRQEVPTDTPYLMYRPPAIYFRVGNVHTNQISDLLMISEVPIANPNEPLFLYGSSTIPFVIPNGRGQEATTIDGRTVINFIKNHEYVVVMGPGSQQVENLALIVAEKVQ